MKYLILLFLIMISFTYISCDTDYSGDAADTFNVYYAVEGGDSLDYSLEFYVSSTNDTIAISSLVSSFISDTLTLDIDYQATESDLYYLKLTNFEDDTLKMIVFKGFSVFKKDTLFGAGVKELKGQF